MAKEKSENRKVLHNSNPEFRRLESEHHRLERELNELVRHRALTSNDALQKKQIQVEKLHIKDRLEAMLREPSARGPVKRG
ncbi:MAG TPA: YdcH family protein [Nitrospiria bacterium]